MKTSLSLFKISNALLFIGSIFSILWSIYFSIVIIFTPYQIEFREGTAQVLTNLFLRGQNPFVFENQPLAMNNYGIGYNLAVLPFAYFFGNTLVIHRVVTFLFIVLASVFSFWLVFHKNADTFSSLACMTIVLIVLIAHGGIGAFPGSMGTFLSLLLYFFLFLNPLNNSSLFTSILISLLAFYTKPYFLLAFGIVSSYLFLFVSKKKGLLYIFYFLVLFIFIFIGCHYLFPLYFINTVVGNVSNTSASVQHLVNQLIVLSFFFFPVILSLVLNKVMSIFDITAKKNKSDSKAKITLNVSSWNSAFVTIQFDYLLYSFIFSLMAFVFILGLHIGSFLNYAYQLVVPTFFFWFFTNTYTHTKIKPILNVMALLNILILTLNIQTPAMLKQKDSAEWAQVYEYLHASSVTLNSPATTAEIIALGQIPMDSGQTAYFYAVEPFSENMLTGTTYDEFFNDGFRYTLLVDRMIEKQRFDLVITTKEKASFYHDKLLQDYYVQVDEIKIDMPQTGQHWTLVIWKPLIK